jgi:hypothetical protein
MITQPAGITAVAFLPEPLLSALIFWPEASDCIFVLVCVAAVCAFAGGRLVHWFQQTAWS